MGKKNGMRAKHIDFILLDIIATAVSLVAAFAIRFGGDNNSKMHGDYRYICVGAIFAYILLMLFTNLHSGILRRGVLIELWRSVLVNVEIVICIVVVLFMFKASSSYSRLMIGIFFVINVTLVFTFRLIRKNAIIKGFKRGKNVSNSILVTHVSEIQDFMKMMNEGGTGYYKFIAVVLLGGSDDSRKSGGEEVSQMGLSIPVLRKKDLLAFAKENVINEAFIVGQFSETEDITDLLLSMGISINMEVNGNIGGLANVTVERFGEYTMLSSTITSGTAGEFLVKRIIDIIVAIIGLIFTGIFFVILGPIIKKQSPGPVFFSQDRVGKNGNIFRIYKFRSMYMDAEERKKELMAQNEMQGLMFKMENDPRIMPIGKFIRKTSIDEFPQFWNILKGDMSLVGTRPPTVDEYKQYAPHHLSRLAIKPGLTGMWQVSGRSDITDFEEVVKLDNEYIRNFSLFLDIKIILRTFGVVVGMKGSS